jgi:hypothetical protein
VLPDGIFFKSKIPIWVNFGGSCKKVLGKFYGHFVYFTAILSILRPFCLFYGHFVYFTAILSILRPFCIHILWPFGIFYSHFGIFSRFGMLYQEISGNPGIGR